MDIRNAKILSGKYTLDEIARGQIEPRDAKDAAVDMAFIIGGLSLHLNCSMDEVAKQVQYEARSADAIRNKVKREARRTSTRNTEKATKEVAWQEA